MEHRELSKDEERKAGDICFDCQKPLCHGGTVRPFRSLKPDDFCRCDNPRPARREVRKGG